MGQCEVPGTVIACPATAIALHSRIGGIGQAIVVEFYFRQVAPGPIKRNPCHNLVMDDVDKRTRNERFRVIPFPTETSAIE